LDLTFIPNAPSDGNEVEVDEPTFDDPFTDDSSDGCLSQESQYNFNDPPLQEDSTQHPSLFQPPVLYSDADQTADESEGEIDMRPYTDLDTDSDQTDASYMQEPPQELFHFREPLDAYLPPDQLMPPASHGPPNRPNWADYNDYQIPDWLPETTPSTPSVPLPVSGPLQAGDSVTPQATLRQQARLMTRKRAAKRIHALDGLTDLPVDKLAKCLIKDPKLAPSGALHGITLPQLTN
jgi:hypothetical protein